MFDFLRSSEKSEMKKFFSWQELLILILAAFHTELCNTHASWSDFTRFTFCCSALHSKRSYYPQTYLSPSFAALTADVIKIFYLKNQTLHIDISSLKGKEEKKKKGESSWCNNVLPEPLHFSLNMLLHYNCYRNLSTSYSDLIFGALHLRCRLKHPWASSPAK